MGDPIRLLAHISICASIFCTFLVVLFTVSIHQRADVVRHDIENRARLLKMRWQVKKMPWIPRVRRQYEDGVDEGTKGILHACSHCQRLACPVGPPGNEGPPGDDGAPGKPGNIGNPGTDGDDVEMDTPAEYPCSICAAGPPGPRGPQGERGLNGEQGYRGKSGEPGNPGIDGDMGPDGPIGPPGNLGKLGLKGPKGEDVISGPGVKGKKGPVGPAGAKGPRGAPGRPSNHPGRQGPPGQSGKQGKPGSWGAYGRRGSPGAPGDAGLSGTYCPSDCGVNTIVNDLSPPNPATHPDGYHKTDDEIRHDAAIAAAAAGQQMAAGYDSSDPRSPNDFEQEGYDMLFNAE